MDRFAPSPSPAAGSPPAERAQVRLLVVEDSQDDYELLRRHLRDAPFDLVALRVDNEVAMRAALHEGGWDAVLSDYNVPGFGARQALALVQAHGLDVPFIIVSGVIGEVAAVEAMQAGADDYVLKDELSRLIPSIERGLRHAAERRGKRAAEDAHRESQRRFVAVTSNMPGIVLRIGLDADGHVLLPFVSEGASELFGVSATALIGHPERLVDAIHAEDVLALLAALEQAARAHVDVRWEGRLRSDDHARWVTLSASIDTAAHDPPFWDGIVTDITHEKAAQAELAASRAELAALGAHQERIKEAERAAIARELHDHIGGLLTGLKVEIAQLRKQPLEADARTRLASMDGLVDEIVQAAKDVARELRPAILDQGLAAALEWQAREFTPRTGIACRFEANAASGEVAPEANTALFRVVQEALTNIAKHARASEVDIHLFTTTDEVTLEVRDNGVGLRAADRGKPDSFGLRSMRERIDNLGGWIEVHGAPDAGTTVMLSVPRAGTAPVSHDATTRISTKETSR